MPVNIPNDLPAGKILQSEDIFVMSDDRARHQDIRPLELLILNLMPTKLITEAQLLRLLGNTPLQVNITLMHMQSHTSKNTPPEHLLAFYRTFNEISHLNFDGMIITGAPIEHLPFEEVNYWPELVDVLEWRKEHVFSAFFICWGAQAALYHYHGVPKFPLEQKMFGIFPHRVLRPNVKLLRGFDETFNAPVSRHTENRLEDVEKVEALETLAVSDAAGLYLMKSRDDRDVFVTGHSEYDPDTLNNEFQRDRLRGQNIQVPYNYFKDDDPQQKPVVSWRAHANLLYSNWLNYYVYQETPYNISRIQAP